MKPEDKAKIARETYRVEYGRNLNLCCTSCFWHQSIKPFLLECKLTGKPVGRCGTCDAWEQV